MRPKKQKYKKYKTNQKVAKNGILTKRLLENQRVRENQNRAPEVVSLQNDARKRHLKSQLLIKKSSTNIQLPYHEESRHLIKWYGCLKSNEGAKTLCFL